MGDVTGSWLGHSQDLSDHLALLLDRPEPTRPQDLDLALHARSAVLGLAAEVHHDVTGLHRKWRSDVPETVLYEHPVAYLGRLLDEQRRPETRRSLVDVLGDEQRNTVGGGWRDVARSATAARHEWGLLDEGNRRLDSTAWTAMHQLAQHCAAVGWLDDSLERDCRLAGRRDEAAILLDSARRLRPAAGSVTSMAASGPLDHLPDLRARPGRRALVIRGPEQVPGGIERLTELVRTSEHVSPLQVHASFRVLGRVVDRAVALWGANASLRLPEAERPLDAAPGIRTAESMADHALTLRRSARDPGRVRSLLPDDALVAAQIDQLSMAAAAIQPPTWRGRPGTALDFACRVASSSVRATFALEEAVASNLADGRWLVPAGDRDPLRFSWVFSTPRHALLDDEHCPTLLRSAGSARARANEVLDALATTSFRSAPSRSTRAAAPVERRRGDLLAAALRDAERRALPTTPRPATTSQPLKQ